MDPGRRAPAGRAVAAGLAALLWLPALVCLGALPAYARGWTWRDGTERLALLSAGAALLLGLALPLVPSARRLLARRAGALAGASLAAALALCGGELWLRRDPLLAREHVRAPGMRLELAPDPALLPGVSGTSRVTTNADGVRGPERSGAYDLRVLCLGGSTTECLYLDDEETWPSLLGRALEARGGAGRCWVGNAGMSGATLDRHLAFVRAAPLAREVDALVVLVGVNDLQRALEGRVPDRAAPWWARTELARRIERARASPAAAAALHQDRAGRGYAAMRARRARARKLDEPPDLTRALDDFEAGLRELAALARARGTRLVLCTQPVLWTDPPDPAVEPLLWFGWSEDPRAFYDAAALRRAIEAFDARLLATCRALDVERVDLAPLSGRRALFYDDCHFSEAGAREVAHAVAEVLAEVLAR